ncbi:unnamed protein product [Coregonus sp. 'balchen']|nr:unnamed protein product [Coregonus sp. 'balchen']
MAFSGASPEMHCFPQHGSVDQNVAPEDHRATFTLSNVVPQQAASNSGPWAQLEVEMRARMGDYCMGPAYVVTGPLPYLSEHWMANRVASGGEIVPVDPQVKASVRGYDVRQMPLDTVETILQQRLGIHISLFHTQCR